jgi:hypothetical protein
MQHFSVTVDKHRVEKVPHAEAVDTVARLDEQAGAGVEPIRSQ